MSNKIVIIGAGSTNFGLGLVGDFFKSKILSGSTLVLHDINSDTLKNTHKIANDYKEKLGVNFKIVSTTSRAEALQEANFCLISIEVGNRFDLWEKIGKFPFNTASNKSTEKTEVLVVFFMQCVKFQKLLKFVRI